MIVILSIYMQSFSSKKSEKMKLKLEVTKEDLEEFQKEEMYKALRRNVVVSHINSQAMHEVYEGYSVVDPDFDDENFLTSFNYCMDVNEPFGLKQTLA